MEQSKSMFTQWIQPLSCSNYSNIRYIVYALLTVVLFYMFLVLAQKSVALKSISTVIVLIFFAYAGYMTFTLPKCNLQQ